MNTKANTVVAASVAPKFLEVTTRSGSLVFTFGNGETVLFTPSDVSDAMREQAMYHGFNQKLRDSVAGFSKDKDYQGAWDAMIEVKSSLVAGEWNRRRSEGGDSASQSVQDLAAAIAEIRSVPTEKARAAVDKATPEQRKAWAKNASIAALIAGYKAQRATSAAAAASDSIDDIDFGM